MSAFLARYKGCEKKFEPIQIVVDRRTFPTAMRPFSKHKTPLGEKR
jgi:hypothetical protein